MLGSRTPLGREAGEGRGGGGGGRAAVPSRGTTYFLTHKKIELLHFLCCSTCASEALFREDHSSWENPCE